MHNSSFTTRTRTRNARTTSHFLASRILRTLSPTEGLLFSKLASKINCSSIDDRARKTLYRLIDAGLVQEMPVSAKTAEKLGCLRTRTGISIYQLTEKGLRAQALLRACPLISGMEFIRTEGNSRTSVAFKLFVVLHTQSLELSMKELVERIGSKEDRIRELIKDLLNLGLVAKIYNPRPKHQRLWTKYLYALSERGVEIAKELVSLSNRTP